MTLPLAKRTALVTGASRGIGRALALELARQGAHVIALARTQGALEEVDDEIRAMGQEATLVPCDLKDYEALDRLGRIIYERWGKLDILAANAGVLGPITPLAHIEQKDWDHVFAINVTANYRLIRSLDMLLRASDAGRVTVLSSSAAHRHDLPPYRTLYAATKAAMEAMVRSYAAETAQTPVRVTAITPGHVRTAMRAQLMPGEDPMTLQTPEDIAPRIALTCQPSWKHSGMLYDLKDNLLKRFQAPA
ncbi:MAG: SDR family NAD(P)-dependent oxidoreductase [Beijerinckiaceae bacterium]|nr:SDR family NAD(P)-dependent oxidoreductase [Beijerinckiaceae bacterium]